MAVDGPYVRESLRRLARAKPKIFGAEEHGFKLNPPLNEIEVAGFEARHRITLQGDYRHFITEIGNGGAGPYYGVFPLGYMDDGFDLAPWNSPSSIVGELAAESHIASRGMTSADALPMNSQIRTSRNTSGK